MSVKIMDDRRSTAKQSKENITRKSAVNLVGEIKSEFRKVSWTSREELQVYTKVVVAATFMFGMAVYFMDIFVQTALSGLNIALRMITG